PRPLWVTATPTTEAPYLHAPDPSPYPAVRDDLRCPRGYSPSFLHNTYTYYGRSFFHIEWYGNITVTKTAGTDNVPGATRAGTFGGSPFNETLTMYLGRPDAMSYTIHGNLPLTIAQPKRRPLHVVSYAETKRFESICSGEATYIDLITYLCSDDQTAAYGLFYNVHMTTLQNLASTIGTTVLAGDCPANFLAM
ncbi:hypothetical protein B0H13DRAFT_2061679, partial [Mycena leptocephala]